MSAEYIQPNESNRFIMRLAIADETGMFAKVARKISELNGKIEHVDLVGHAGRKEIRKVIRDVSVWARDAKHAQRIICGVKKIPKIEVATVSDVTFLAHRGGKLEVQSKIPLKTPKDLSIAYTPGVGRVAMAIADNPEQAFNLTMKKNTVAIVSDGSAVLGLGDIGPYAALPVMEGKACIFKEFAGIDAFPICLDTNNAEEIIRIVKAIAPGFGGINLEDISAPRCFAIEERLKNELDIPVFHDDQHGTAVIVLAALRNALKFVHKNITDSKIIVIGVGAAGVAVSKMLLHEGARNLIGIDTAGALYRGRTLHMNGIKQWYAEHTNPGGLRGSLHEVGRGADVLIGFSVPGTITVRDVKNMNTDAIVFALANPIPEIMPEEAAPYVRIMATGRSDYLNQINNSLCFPGMFRGAFDARASTINEEMKIAAAHAIASLVSDEELSEEYIIPSMFDKRVVPAVAKAVARAALKSGVARMEPKHGEEIRG